jgi:ADP-ribose pyrophosphatase
VSTPPGREVVRIEVVRDLTPKGIADGFLRFRRLALRNVHADGSVSEEYVYDMVSRRIPDAVALVLYDVAKDGSVRVALRTGIRPPVYLRRFLTLPQPDEGECLQLLEIVAGILEDSDAGPGGIERRAALEAREEAGYEVRPEDVEPLGAPMFPTPGITDEKVFFRAARVDLSRRGVPTGDGSVLEQGAEVVVLPLDEAIRRCREGGVPVMIAEIALLRLRDRLRR